jgi:Gpi18-like mannosyltransferase
VSAWWGQYEPIYVLPALLAVLTARAGRPGWTAVLVAISLMTKPQALPFVVSFAAWFLATQGWRGTLRAAGIGAVTVLVVWLPFLAANGPINYLRNLGTYQNELYNVVSVSAWNPWWLLQEFRADGQYVLDSGTLIGPISYRVVSLALTAVFSFVVFLAVYRRPSAEQLALGLGVIALVTFVGLTTMHERYAYPAFVFLLLAATRRRVAVTWLAFAIVFLLNMVAVVPPDGWDPSALEALAPIGAVVMTILAAAATIDLVRARPTRLDVPT